MSSLAAIRPDEWNLPLFVHVFGAMVLVGALAAAVSFQVLGWRRQDPASAASFARLGFRTLLFVAFPAWGVMRIGAQWIYDEEDWGSAAEEPAWLGVGFVTADGGGVLVLVALVLAGLGARRLRRLDAGSSALVRVATVLVTIATLAFVVAVWTMSAKPA
jgi:uncharacterized membrane protein